MDPAGVKISPKKSEKEDSTIHCLSLKDALLVQILHTAIKGNGIATMLGTQDFYANGGVVQDGPKRLLSFHTMIWSHLRAINFFNAAIYQVALAIGYVIGKAVQYIFGIHHRHASIAKEDRPIFLPTLSKPPFFTADMVRPEIPNIEVPTYEFNLNRL